MFCRSQITGIVSRWRAGWFCAGGGSVLSGMVTGASGWNGDEEEKDGLPVRLLSPSRDRRMNMLS